MDGKYLTLEQNTCAARIFLNTFGLTLENINDINEFSTVKIFDKDMNEVGELHFDNGNVMISANYNNCTLEANYAIAKMTQLVDVEGQNALFGQWYSKIAFQAKKGNNQTFDGEFIVDCTMDSEFGINCICHPLIKSTILGNNKITLKILRNGCMFGLEISSEDYNETINITPWKGLDEFIKHVITSGKYDEQTYKRKYKKYAGIFNGAETNENKSMLHIFLNEEKDNMQLNFRNEFVPKIGNDDSEDVLLQKGYLMQQLDPDMYKTIEKLRKVLFIGDVSLLDNLISICYDDYTDEALASLLGIKRQTMNYQDGADKLVDSYFGIGKNACFILTKEQNKLLK